ncbi:hypothetical protein EB231_32810 [Mesorhizobium sp. NZP2298]|nr:hypothetical protein EB231_32810 [Mesorhizobium sp. NZP2298]
MRVHSSFSVVTVPLGQQPWHEPPRYPRGEFHADLDRAKAAGLNWPLLGELTDDALEHRVFIRAGVKKGQRRSGSYSTATG